MRRILPLLLALGACSNAIPPNVDRSAAGFDNAKYETDLRECYAASSSSPADDAEGVLTVIGGTLLTAVGLMTGADGGYGSVMMRGGNKGPKTGPTAVIRCMEIRGYTMKAD